MLNRTLFSPEMQDTPIFDLPPSQDIKDSSGPLPSRLPVFPLFKRPLFPGMVAPLAIEPGPLYEVLKQVSSSKTKCIALLLAKGDSPPPKGKEIDFFSVGVMARILRIIPLEAGGAQVVVSVEKRICVKKMTKTKHGHLIHAYYLTDVGHVTEELKAYAINIVSTIKEILKLNPLFKEELQVFLAHSDFTEPGKMADFAVSMTTASKDELQDVLETLDIQARIDKALVLLKKELDLSRLQTSINQKIETAISKTQKEFFLREQLKTIKKELGLERDEKSLDIQKFEGRIKDKRVPEHALKVIREELEKFSTLETSSAEYSLSRNYLDWLTILPWDNTSDEPKSLKEVRKVLDKDHFGMKDVKERIVEFVGVSQLTKSQKGSIICLIGPPGVGKTSIGRSIAKALGRKFFRFSVGGMRDEAEIKGHRRTYIGAMPGKLIQALKHTETLNPVILIDEVDKINSSYHGDPASALLEVLDPEQNSEFLDHYLDVHVDLSKVLFILTANMMDTIPEALKDRMEVIRLSGYILEEKLKIAQKYLLPKNSAECGLKPSDFDFKEKALIKIIDEYAREAGVRNFEACIKKLMRKIAVAIAEGKHKANHPYIIDEKAVVKYLGKPIFTSDRYYQEPPAGVAVGLAWTAMGGATLYIETTQAEQHRDAPSLKLTGMAGEVMKESSQIAWTYARLAAQKWAPRKPFFENRVIHMHIPEGATPKDGPSAGITMVTALLSLLLNKPLIPNLGMTGELTLTGRVLPIGGVKEKVIAAKRSGLTTLIFPKENAKDYSELAPYIKKGIKAHFVETYDEVFKIAFGIK